MSCAGDGLLLSNIIHTYFYGPSFVAGLGSIKITSQIPLSGILDAKVPAIRRNGSRFGRWWKWGGNYLLTMLLLASKVWWTWVFAAENFPFQCLVPSFVGMSSSYGGSTASSRPLDFIPVVCPWGLVHWWLTSLPLLQSTLQFCKHCVPVLDPVLLEIPGMLYCVKLTYTSIIFTL